MTRRTIDDYADIINLPHHQSKTHPRMSNADRAAQFSPFAALTGYDAAVEEAARLTDERFELSEYRAAVLNEKLDWLYKNLSEQPQVTIAYFVPDDRKDGGSYMTKGGCVKKIDDVKRIIMLEDQTVISINDIFNIEISARGLE